MKPRNLAIALASVVVLAVVFILVFADMWQRLLGLSAVLFLLTGFLIHLNNWHKYLAYLMLLTLPFSVEIPFGSFKVAVPSEPLTAMAAFVTVLWVLTNSAALGLWWRQGINKAALIFMGVMVIGVLLSPMLLVSAKFTLVNVTFYLAGGLFFYLLFLRGDLTPKQALSTLAISFTAVALYGLTGVLSFNFSLGAAPVVGKPFFSDHTIYSASLALMVPFILLAGLRTKGNFRWFYLLMGLAVLVLIVQLSSRATWLGLIAALALGALLVAGMRWKHFLALMTVAALLGFLFFPAIIEGFAANRNDSDAYDATLEEQALSVTNISSDVSNLERINRWKCALRMGNTKPVFGYGPGTYQFTYLPFQVTGEMTRISVITPFNHVQGRGGTAHSEWLLAFAEMGWPGLLAWTALIMVVFFQALQLFSGMLLPRNIKWLVVASLLGFTTYFVHSFFNNFLNQPQFGMVFWLLVTVVAYYAESSKTVHEAR